MKDIRPSELIHSEEFLKEPVHKAVKEIENFTASKIILRGEGTGKSTLLCYMKDKKANTENPFILINFDPAGLSIKEDEIFTKKFFEHYWEINFAKRLLWYIKNYYELTYYSYFEKYSELINQSSTETVNIINKSLYIKNPTLSKMYSQYEITGEILEEFKKQMNIESFWLSIDSFDHINNSDPLTQKILSSYFDLFDKTIISANDESLSQEWDNTHFKEDSEIDTYQLYTIEYSKDLETIYMIITKRINKYNSSCKKVNQNNDGYFKPFPLEWFNNYDILNLLVTRTNGNIRIMFEIINKLITDWKFYDSIEKLNIKKIMEQEENEILERKLRFKQPKLHL